MAAPRCIVIQRMQHRKGRETKQQVRTLIQIMNDLPIFTSGPPYVRPLGELKAVVGKPFSVICPAAGYPLEKVTWTKGEFFSCTRVRSPE